MIALRLLLDSLKMKRGKEVTFILFCLFITTPLFSQTAQKLQILLPGMTAAPNTGNGYTGAPEDQTTGIPFNIIVNAVDENWNIVPVTDQISLSSSDPLAELPLPVNLVNGTATLTVILNSEGNKTVTAYDESDPSVENATSLPVKIVKINYFTISQIGDPYGSVPGQTKVGQVNSGVQITARNESGIVKSYNGKIYLNELTDYGEGRIYPQSVFLTEGVWTGDLTLFRAGKKTAHWGVTGDVWINVTDDVPPTTKMEIIITADKKYDLYVNGSFVGSDDQLSDAETYLVPLRDGKNVIAVYAKRDWEETGGVIAEIRIGGQTVYLTDQFWLRDPHLAEGWTDIDFDDSNWTPVNDRGVYGVDPWGTNIDGFPTNSQAHWIWGSWNGEYLRGSFQMENGAITPPPSHPHIGESNRFCVTPEKLNQLLTILPGETYMPGSFAGKANEPIDQQAGAPFTTDVYATDVYWNQIPLVNHTISLASTDPDASFPNNTAMTNGHVQMNVTLNTPGKQTITSTDISDGSVLPNTSSELSIIAQSLDHFEINPISSPQTAGNGIPITVSAINSDGVPTSDFSGWLDLSISTGNQTISPIEVYMTNGVWSGEIVCTKAASLVTITVEDRTEPPHIGNSNQFTVQPGATSRLQVLLPGETATPGIAPGKMGTPSEILAGSSLQARVNAVDNWWNVTTNNSDVMQVTSTDPSAQLPQDAALSSGTRQFIVTFNTTGLQTISAHDISQPSVSPGTSSQIRVNPGNMHHFVFNPIIGPVTAGNEFTIAVTAVDFQGNPVEAYSGVVTLEASTGAGTITPTSINMNQATWTGNVTLTKATAGAYLTVSDAAPSQHTGSSNEFTVKPSSLSQLQVLVPGLTATPGLSPGYTGNPQSQNSGAPFSITVNGVDQYWNVVTTASDSFAVASTDTSASLPLPIHLVNGTRTLSITLIGDGAHTISAFHLTNPNIANGQSPYITVLPQDLDHFTISQINGPVTVGETVEITVRAETNTNTIVYNFNGIVDLSASTGDETVIPQSIGPFVQGEWNGEIVLKKAESGVTISASDQVTPPHSGISNLFTVVHGSFEKLQVLLPGESAQPGLASGKIGSPADQQTAAQFDVTVCAVDKYWNLVSEVIDSISITTTDNAAMLPGNSKLISGKAILPLVMGSPGTHTVTALDESNDNILAGISSPFNVSPGSLDHFEFQTIGDQVAGDDFQVQITAADQAGNPVVGFNGHARIQSTTGDGTLSPTEIMFVDGLWSGMITITRATSNARLTCLDYASNPHSGQSDPFAISAGEFTRLQILLPGETSTPGIAPGKTGEIGTQISGEALAVTVNAVDNWWNPATSATATIGLTSTDENANLPLETGLQSGSITFTDMRFNTPGYWTITAYCSSILNISSDTSPLVHVITGSVASFQFDPIHSPQVAGDTINVTIRAVDGSGTPVTNYNEMASVTSSTGPGTVLIDDVQFANGEWSGAIILTKAVQSAHLNIHDFADIVRGNSNPFVVLPDKLAKLQIILPGETATPGLEKAKEGIPVAQTLGVPFQIKVNATDAWWNLVDPENILLHFESSDNQASLPADTVQYVSSKTYPLALLAEGENLIYVTSPNNPSLKDTSSTFYVGSGQIDHFVFSQIDTQQVAGKAFPLRIEAYNDYDYPVTDYSGDIILSASTGNGTISKTGVTIENGFWEGNLYITRASADVVLYAADYVPSPNTHTGYSNKFNVSPDSLAGIQVLLPGETATPGVEPGKNSSPTSQTAGTAIDVAVRAIDSYWNIVPDISDTLSVQVSDSFAVIPNNILVEDGSSQFSITMRAAGKHNVAVEFIHNNEIPVANSDSLIVRANTFSQLLLVLPGESVLPGDNENDPLNTPGRENNSSAQTSGLPFTVDVFAVDDYWNPVSTAPPDTIRLFTTDNSATITPLDTILVDGKTKFSVTLNQGGNQVLRAIDETNSNIRTSLDGVTEVLVGGIHYEIVLDTNKVSAGQVFGMEIFYKNGVGERIAGANHLVRLLAVSSSDLEKEVGLLENSSFNLQAGYRKIEQKYNNVGTIRIKIEDDIGTDPAYSDPLEVVSGQVAKITVDSVKSEIRGAEKTWISVKLTDAVGNAVPDQEVQFHIAEGSGQLMQTIASSDTEGIAAVQFVGGQSSEVNVIRAEYDTMSVDIEIIVNLTPSTLSDGVLLNYPNPFGLESPVTHIDYYLPEDADVTLQIFDLFGNLVWKKDIDAGMPGAQGRSNTSHPNSVEWNGENGKGQRVGNGGYILIGRAVNNSGKVVMENRRKIAVLR